MDTVSPWQTKVRTYRRLTFGVLVLGVAVIFIVELYAGSFNGWPRLLTLWTLLPMSVLYGAAVIAARPGASLTALIGTLCCVLFGSVCYLKGFIFDPDPQSGGMFLLVPYYQLLAGLILLGIACVDWLRNKDRMESMEMGAG